MLLPAELFMALGGLFVFTSFDIMQAVMLVLPLETAL